MIQKKLFPRTSIGQRWALLATKCAFALLAIVSVSSCNISRRPYLTIFNISSISELIQDHGKLCIVSFSSDPSLYTSSGEELTVNPGMLPLTIVEKNTNRKQAAEITTKLTSAHFEKIVAGLSERFLLVGPLVYGERKNPLTQTQKIADAIAQDGADFGLIIHDQFGWSWASENTGVESYYFTTCATIYNGEGQSIWKFCNKGSIYPKLADFKTFLSGVAGGAPPMETILGDFDPYFINYPRFVLRLIEEDAAGKAHAAWFEDYFPTKRSIRNRQPFIININDERYLPNFP
jgi:hypothetical protein